MTGFEEIQRELWRSFWGDPWHGPGVKQALEGIPQGDAFLRVSPEVHTVAEIVSHMSTWIQHVRKSLGGSQPVEKVTPEQDWPSDFDSDDWDRVLKGLDDDYEQLVKRVGQLAECEILESVPGTETTRFDLVMGILLHNIYHAGQISLLKKMTIGGAR